MVMSLSRRALVALCALLASTACLVVALPVAPAAAATNAQLASRLTSKINAIRAMFHWPQLVVDPRLVNRAETHNLLAACTGQLAQNFYREPALATRLSQLGYQPAAAAQVLGAASTQAGVVRLANQMAWDNRRYTVYAPASYSNIGADVHWSPKRREYVVTVVVARPIPFQQQAAASVLATLNAERAAHRLPALTMDSRLVASAHRHNLVMAASNTMSHQLPGEASLGQRLLSVGYRYYYGGENVAWTTDQSVAGLVSVHVAMYNEVPPYDGHRRNILSPNYRNVGIDVVIDAAHGKAWITEDFGRLQ